MIAINKTAFAKTEDFTRGLLEVDMNARSFPLGGIPLYTQGTKAYLDTSDSHSIIFGATGSKKTRLFVMPSVEFIYRSGEAFLVTDPKGEIYQKTKDSAALNDYHVFCLDLRNLKTSSQWNPLQLPYELYYSGHKEKALEMLTELSAHIIGDTGEQFWTNVGVDLLLGFILLLVLNNSCEACTIRNLLRLWNQYTTNEKGFVRSLKDKEFRTDELTDSKLRMVYNQADKTVGSAQAIVSTGLNKLIINDDLLDLLSTTTVPLRMLANEKVGIYLIIPDENSSYHFIASLFISQMYEVLIQTAQKSESKALQIRMNFVIDEFANLPRLNNIDSMITASRSRNIRFALIVQGLTQLNDKYGSAAQTLCGNCNNWIYLYSKDYELLRTLSNLCGEVIYENQTKLPLLSEFDLQHLSKENGEVLILAGRKYPYLSHLTDIDEYPFFRETVSPTPDATADKPKKTRKPRHSVDVDAVRNRVRKQLAEERAALEEGTANQTDDSLEVSLNGTTENSTADSDAEFEARGKEIFRLLHPELCKPVPGPADNFSDINPGRFSSRVQTTLFDVMSHGERRDVARSWSCTNEPLRWVVAVYDGVIIGETTPPESEVYAPDIFETLVRHFKGKVLTENMIRQDIEFYHTDMKYKKEFEDYLQKHPEAVYLRLDEMEHPEEFIKISKGTDDCKEEYKPIEEDDDDET